MWRLVCLTEGLEVEIGPSILADARVGVGEWVPLYPAAPSWMRGKRVVNPTTSVFRFENGAIVEHTDLVDPRAWARQMFGAPAGFVIGRVEWLRRGLARSLLPKAGPETGD